MTRHGWSHGLGTLLTVIAGGLLVDRVREHVPALRRILDIAASEAVSHLHLPFSVTTMSAVMIGSALAMCWGICFGLLQDRRG